MRKPARSLGLTEKLSSRPRNTLNLLAEEKGDPT